MATVSSGMHRRPPGRLVDRVRLMSARSNDMRHLEADSHRPEIQELIRDAIRRGAVRVVPEPGSVNRVRIVPVNEDAAAELAQQIWS